MYLASELDVNHNRHFNQLTVQIIMWTKSAARLPDATTGEFLKAFEKEACSSSS